MVVLIYIWTLSGVSSLSPIGTEAQSNDAFLVILTRISWIVLPIVLTIFGQRYFKKRDEEKKQHSEMLDKLSDNIRSLEKALIPILTKIEGTAQALTEVMRDVKEHDKIITKISVLLEQKGKQL